MSPRPKKVLINSHKQHKNCQSSSVPQPRGEIRRDHPTAVRSRPISERHSSKIRRPVRNQTKPSTPKFRWNCQTRLDKQPHPKSADIERNRQKSDWIFRCRSESSPFIFLNKEVSEIRRRSFLSNVTCLFGAKSFPVIIALSLLCLSSLTLKIWNGNHQTINF